MYKHKQIDYNEIDMKLTVLWENFVSCICKNKGADYRFRFHFIHKYLLSLSLAWLETPNSGFLVTGLK